jgi:hypothetical protein
MPVLADPALRVHPADMPLGYELSGNRPVQGRPETGLQQLPPVGDGQWHLYDLRRTRARPATCATSCRRPSRRCRSRLRRLGPRHGVLPMPDGYNPTRQVLINTFVNYWIPGLPQHGAGGAGWAWWPGGRAWPGARRRRVAMSAAGYLDSPWPGEDGGPAAAAGAAARQRAEPAPGGRLRCTTAQHLLSTMTVLGAPGEVYLLTHSALRSHLGLPTTACVEQIDPHHAEDAAPLAAPGRRTDVAGWHGGAPQWQPDRRLRPLGAPAEPALRARWRRPEVAAGRALQLLRRSSTTGIVVTKNLSACTPARLSTVDADTLEPVCADVECPEPSIARLSASGNTVYVVGVRSIFRYHWTTPAQRLVADPDWRHDYIGTPAQTHGWDVVLDGGHAWFMDNGRHRYPGA